MRPVKLKSVKGKVGWEKQFLLLTACLNFLGRSGPISLLGAATHALPPRHTLYFPPAPSGRNSTGRSLVTSRWQTNYMLGTEGRREWPLSLYPLTQRLLEAAAVNAYWYVNGLRPGRRFWKFCNVPHRWEKELSNLILSHRQDALTYWFWNF